ncbi:MAG: hypothetical protein ACMXYF_03095 [Candidatus Woesearchaeota archaeon]
MTTRDWHKEKIVSIDLDGVLSHYDGWKGEDVLGEPLAGAKEFVLHLLESGYTPVVFSAREPELIVRWLEKFHFPKLEVTRTKYPSIVYIDDRCVKFEGNFSKLKSDLKNYNVYWKSESEKPFDDLDDS